MLEKGLASVSSNHDTSTFGVYLGSFSKNLSSTEKALLLRWDVVILDPFAAGVRQAASSSFWSSNSRRLIARLDVSSAAAAAPSDNKPDQVIKCLDFLSEAVTICLKNARGDDLQSPFSGIMLCGFRSHFQPTIINQLASWINRLGLELWLELSPPDYLSDREATGIDASLLRGLVYRNATIQCDGDRQNYIQMEQLRRTMRGVAAQRAQPGPDMALWETIDDNRPLDHAVITRTYNWSTYNSAQCWIGHNTALTDATTAMDKRQAVASAPLGALRWLKDENNMRIHETWRVNQKTSTLSCGNDETFALLEDFVPDLASKLHLFPPQTVAEHEQPGSRDGKSRGPRLHPGHSYSFDNASLWKSQNSVSQSMISGIDKLPMLAPLSSAVSGDDFTGLGCFQLGQVATFADFAELRQGQRRLRDLELLQRLQNEDLTNIFAPISTMAQWLDAASEPILSNNTMQAIRDLIDLLGNAIRAEGDSDEGPSVRLQVFSGLHTGFQGSARMQFWGLYDVDIAGAAVVYLSAKAEKNRPGVLLHTYLSSRQCTRTECFAAEVILAMATGELDEKWQLPHRLVADIKDSSNAEVLLLVQRLAEAESTEDDDSGPDLSVEDIKEEYRSLLLKPLRHCCEYQLLEVPSLTQQRELASVGYLSGEVSGSQLVTTRLAWLDSKGCWTPDPAKAEALFTTIDARLYEVLMTGQSDLLASISTVLGKLLLPDEKQQSKVDAAVDILALAIFSAFRRYGLDEIYLEVLDRNVYPNHMAEQAGIFAEYYALGSRCDWFFDTTPIALGRILADRYRIYYRKHQPPRRDVEILELPTVYAAMQVDLDVNDGREKLAYSYRITFFGVFALPALIDISLLTTIGRGLYLTTFMTSSEKTLATTALMISLLISGTFGSWIGTGGIYYFNANAFPAMNMFVLTRFVAGLATTVIIGVLGFIIIWAVQGSSFSALVFLAYFVLLSCYMLTLNALAIYQLPGSSFLSGRTIIMSCIPILFISPIVSIFTGHDIAIYLPVLSFFLITLMLGARKVISQWSSWYLNIPSVTDAEVVAWFRKWIESHENQCSITASTVASMTESQLMPMAQRTLCSLVLAEHNRQLWMIWRRRNNDALVMRLAKGYAASMFLMRWYCKHKSAYMPLPYSSTWNLTLNAAIQNMMSMQKGLRLHSAFLHWRSTGHDIWAGFLYFVVILLDKWAALLTGGNLVGLSAAGSPEFRLGVGFGLCYYLIGAISLDIISQPLWAAANTQADKPISSLENMTSVMDSNRRIRRSVYWRHLIRFFFLHIWGAAVVSALMWTFQDSRDETIVFLSYIGSYWGLLWYQFNKIFCGQKTAAPLASGALAGLPIGLALHKIMPEYAYSGVISLAVASWVACVHSACAAGIIRWPRWCCGARTAKTKSNDRKSRGGAASIDGDGNVSREIVVVNDKEASLYTASMLEPHPDLSQQTLSKIYDSTCTLPADQRQLLNSTEQETRDCISQLLALDDVSPQLKLVRDAFPSAKSHLKAVLASWFSGNTLVELVSSKDFAQQQEHNKLRAIARRSANNRLHLFVVLSDVDFEEFRGLENGAQKNAIGWFRGSSSSRHWRIVGEAMVSATCELVLGLSHSDSMLAELLVKPESMSGDNARGDTLMSTFGGNGGDGSLSHIPEGIRRRLEASPTERARVIEDGDYTILRYVLLGLDSECEWEALPQLVRASLIRRNSAFFPLCSSYGPSVRSILPLSQPEKEWLQSRLSMSPGGDVDGTLQAHLARCRLGASLYLAVVSLARGLDASYGFEDEAVEAGQTYDERLLTPSEPSSRSIFLARWVGAFWRRLRTCLKFLVLSLTADPEYQRELEYVVQGLPAAIKWPAVFFLNTIWSYCKLLQSFVVPFVLFHAHDHISKLRTHMKGMMTMIERSRVVTESFAGPSTLFWRVQEDGSLRVCQYSGNHDQEPPDAAQPQPVAETTADGKNSLVAAAPVSLVNELLIAVNIYEAKDRLRLREREEYHTGQLVNKFQYEYASSDGSQRRTKRGLSYQLPLQRRCTDGECNGELVQYSKRGHINTGSAIRTDNQRVSWTFHYRENAKYEDELLWAEYTFPHISIKVLWSMPPPKGYNRKLMEWLPFSGVTEATFTRGDSQWHASWSYEHKFHPELTVTLNGEPLETPPLMIVEDWYHVLQKPKGSGSFLAENPLLSFSSIDTSFLTRWFGLNVRHFRIPTSVARTQLWKAWKNGTSLDAISARWLDEDVLRADKVMRSYWFNRDFGRLAAAKKFLDERADTVMACVDVDPQTSSWVHVAYKMSDLYSFGQGGDASINTRTMLAQLHDTEDDRGQVDINSQHNKSDELHILAMDTSTWPNDPGGVSACRRDMVNDLKTIRWHIVAESANDYGVPRFQIERNVQSLTILPLWGLDFLNPTHGVLESRLDSAVVQRSYDTRTEDIVQNFIPILTSLVRMARTVNLTRQDIEESTRALVDLNTYFESTRNWNDVWHSPVVKEKWRELWLSEGNDPADDRRGFLKPSEWWDFERPSIRQLDQALDLWSRYLFIFSISVPERIPDVFQVSHHFVGATYGIVCKIKRQCTLHLWDHCISYREFSTFMSSAVSFDSAFVNSTLISFTHLSCILLEHHADVVLPCCDYFNPWWEVELGTAEGALEHRNTFSRKIDPVVNGICNMEKFKPIKTIKTPTPTVIMLSHVQYAKDIKNAILATDIIVNKWGFTDYRLHVYGDKERAATLATECQQLISAKNLQDHCILKGVGTPSVVLQDAWLFLNSSISEGLPLAMGEAALTGVPVVCTDVGASYCVVTDSATGDHFSEVVPPNDPESLARAQINIMALLGRWSAYAGDDETEVVPLLDYPMPSPQQVKDISQRMYAKTEERRALGMLGRQNVLNNFSAERYLREHEQMLWLGKLRSPRVRHAFHQSSFARLQHEHDVGLQNMAPSSPYPLSLRSASAFFASTSQVDIVKMSAQTNVTGRRASRLTPQSWSSLSNTIPDMPRTSWWLTSGASSMRDLLSIGTEDKNKNEQPRSRPQRTEVAQDAAVFNEVVY